MIFLTFAEMCDALPEDFHWGEPLTPAVFKHIELAIEQAHRATAEQSRDSVIEECAKLCDEMANQFEDQRQFALDLCSDAIRALKSQQDAAIESKRSGNGESS